MEKEYKNLLMGIYTKDSMQMESHQDLVNIIGQMEATLKEHLKMASEMGMECGKKVQETMINMKENILMIKNVDMGYSHGQLAMYTRVITKQMSEMDMERCIGMMEVFIKETGIMESNMDKGKFSSQVKDIKKGYFRIIT